MLISVKDVVKAKRMIASHIHHTPLVSSKTFSEMSGMDLYMKCENFQKTGSFKVRGGMNNLLALTPKQLKKGVVTSSSGNHAQGVAYAAKMLGINCVVCMGDWSSPAKIAACKAYGAKVEIVKGDSAVVLNEARRLADAHGYEFISWDSTLTLAGQGTVGLEILKDLPDVDAIVAPISSGGIISGTAVAVKELLPEVKVYGVQPENSAAMKAALDAGRPVKIECNTCCDGLTATIVDESVLKVVEHYVDDVITLSEMEIKRAVLQTLQYTKMLIEPSSATTIAAMLGKKIPAKGKVVAILSGGNMSMGLLEQIIVENRGLSS